MNFNLIVGMNSKLIAGKDQNCIILTHLLAVIHISFFIKRLTASLVKVICDKLGTDLSVLLMKQTKITKCIQECSSFSQFVS